jgi:malonyl-CoA decarboxylase
VIDVPYDEGDEITADTATFYSITNCQTGLRGIQLGNFLIKQVVRELVAELPQLTGFSTLSPVPGFARWLAGAQELAMFDDGDREALRLLGNPDWHEDRVSADALRPVLMRACAHYLLRVKQKKHPADSVARFHLRNGAHLERINWLGDVSPNGLRQSHGLLVNYVYGDAEIASNHEAYVHDGTVAHSPAIDRLLQPD